MSYSGNMEPAEGFEPPPVGLQNRCSAVKSYAGMAPRGRIRTPNLLVQSQAFCQLNYRGMESEAGFEPACAGLQPAAYPLCHSLMYGGRPRSRTLVVSDGLVFETSCRPTQHDLPYGGGHRIRTCGAVTPYELATRCIRPLCQPSEYGARTRIRTENRLIDNQLLCLIGATRAWGTRRGSNPLGQG